MGLVYSTNYESCRDLFRQTTDIIVLAVARLLLCWMDTKNKEDQGRCGTTNHGTTPQQPCRAFVLVVAAPLNTYLP